MKQLSCKSFAKLNLCLHVINRRDDGYHDIQGIFHVIDLYDTIVFRMNEGSSVNLHASDKNLMNNPENDELLRLLDENGDEAAQL